ncbi:MAG TPA: DUF3043 domain-containing protein [Nocardioides sp.]|nr:DUF3043 domain-containing protein [Nocardioides sp.]
MFKRSKPEENSAEALKAEAKEGGKGRPTPTRKEAEAAARERAKVPRTRKEMAAAERQRRMSSQQKAREAMKTGDDRYLPARDKGPVRRFVRDFVDSRFSIVEMLIPLLVVSLFLGWSGNQNLRTASSLVLMVTFLFVIIDIVLLSFRLRRHLNLRFPDESTKGATFYAATRSMQMKFLRMPKARVKVGQQLPEDYDR